MYVHKYISIFSIGIFLVYLVAAARYAYTMRMVRKEKVR
jgi:hypothetical protein